MIYLDSSALLKLLVDEPESAALEAWLATREGTPVVTSELARVEVPRACRRVNADAVPLAMVLLSELDHVALSRPLLDQAATVGEDSLRSLDAIHLVSALSIRSDLTGFVAYDARLAGAAAAAGLDCVRPGP